LGAGVRHEAAAPARARCAIPPGRGGLFGFKFSSSPHPRKFGVHYFWSGRLLARKWGGPFLGYLLRKNLSARERPQDVALHGRSHCAAPRDFRVDARHESARQEPLIARIALLITALWLDGI